MQRRSRSANRRQRTSIICKKKDRLAAAFPQPTKNYLGRRDCFQLPAPSNQSQRPEAASE